MIACYVILDFTVDCVNMLKFITDTTFLNKTLKALSLIINVQVVLHYVKIKGK